VRPTVVVPPVYPSMLQSQGIEGFVAYAVRVRPDGRADPSTLRVDTVSHPLFATAARNTLPRYRWDPTAQTDPRWFTHVVRWVMLPADSGDGSACPRSGSDTTVVCARRRPELHRTSGESDLRPVGPRSPTLGPEERYVWYIRASHTDALLMAAGDSVDVVLLRSRCGAYSGHGRTGCWDANTIDVSPGWHVTADGVARVRPLPEGAWRFGRGTAGARLHALRPGAAAVTATLPDGEVVSDSLWVVAAPGAVRILLEPKPTAIVAGDTVRFRVTARDAEDRIVAILPLSRMWSVAGPPDSLGYTPMVFPPGHPGGRLVPRLGRLTDTLELRIVEPRKP
jgi:hypothetical protein